MRSRHARVQEHPVHRDDAEPGRAEVLEGFQEAIELARLRADPSAMIAGWREIAKMCGYYAPERKQVELSTAGSALRTQYEEMTDADLANVIAAVSEATGRAVHMAFGAWYSARSDARGACSVHSASREPLPRRLHTLYGVLRTGWQSEVLCAPD